MFSTLPNFPAANYEVRVQGILDTLQKMGAPEGCLRMALLRAVATTGHSANVTTAWGVAPSPAAVSAKFRGIAWQLIALEGCEKETAINPRDIARLQGRGLIFTGEKEHKDARKMEEEEEEEQREAHRVATAKLEDILSEGAARLKEMGSTKGQEDAIDCDVCVRKGHKKTGEYTSSYQKRGPDEPQTDIFICSLCEHYMER